MTAKPDSSRSTDDNRIEALRSGVDPTRKEMNETLDRLEARLNPEVLGARTKTELERLEVRIKGLVNEELREVRVAVAMTLTAGIKDAKAAVSEGFSVARQTVKDDVRDAITHAKRSVREATLGRVEHLATKAGDVMNDTRDTFVETIRQNPIPASVAAIGIAWLLMNRSSANRPSPSFGGPGAHAGPGGPKPGPRADEIPRQHGGVSGFVDDLGHGITSVEHAVAEAATDVAEHAGRSAGQVGAALAHAGSAAAGAAHDATIKAKDAVGHGAEAVDHLAHRATEAASRVAHDAGATVQATAHKVETGVAAGWETNPLAFGAAALLAGAALGYALPRTEKENRLMGGAADAAIRRASRLATGAIRSVQQLADDAEKAAQDVVESRVTH